MKVSSLVSSVLVLAVVGCGCGGSAPPAVSPSDVATALCVAKAVKAAGDPRALKPEAAVALALKVAACFPKAPAAQADAGASDGGR